jgi:nicotinic acid mononucleotide adenylyltransferase
MLFQQEPETDFTFCLGSDAFGDLANLKWKRSEDVLSLGRFVVIDRSGAEELKKRIQQQQQQQTLSNIRLLQLPALDAVSSTMIRSCRNEETLKLLLAPAVFDFMKKQKMYRFAETDVNGS